MARRRKILDLLRILDFVQQQLIDQYQQPNRPVGVEMRSKVVVGIERRIYISFVSISLSVFNGADLVDYGFDVAVAEQYATADFVCADLAAVYPVGGRYERNTQTAGGFSSRKVPRVGFRMCETELLQLVSHRLTNYLRELVGIRCHREDLCRALAVRCVFAR